MLRKTAITLLLPLIWRLLPGQRSRMLRRFARVEADSSWQSLHAIRQMSDPVVQAHLFEHALEEMSHAEIFDNLAATVEAHPGPLVVGERKPLLEGNDHEARLRFFAREYLGEERVHGEFSAYIRAVPAGPIRQAFERVFEDEVPHATESGRHLENQLAREPRYHWIVRHERLREGWAQFSDVMARIGEIPLALLLTILYFLCGPWLATRARARLRSRS